jgi:autotransporter-associated beta strand protein
VLNRVTDQDGRVNAGCVFQSLPLFEKTNPRKTQLMKPRILFRCSLFVASIQSLHATVSSVGVDSTTGPNWRTAANITYQADGQYGTSGYVVYGLNAANGVYTQPYNATAGNSNNVFSLPAGITVVTADTNIGMWSGNGNFGNIEDPGNGNAITVTPLLANSAGPKRFTISRSHVTPMRLTLMTASGDGAGANFSPSVDDGSGAVSTAHTHTANGVVYHVFDISSGFTDIVINITSSPNWSLTGMAFDEVLPPPVTVNWITDGNGDWSNPANWDDVVPNAVGALAVLASPPLTASATVTLDEPVTLGILSFSGFEGYTVAGGSALTFDNNGLSAVVNVSDGLHEISAPVVLAGNTAVNPAVGSELVLSGSLTGGSTFGVGGGGTVNLNGDITGFTGGFAINSGVMRISPATPLLLNQLISGGGSLVHAGAGELTISGLNTWSGGLVVTDDAEVVAGSNVALGSGPVTLSAGKLTITGDSNLGVRNLRIGGGDGQLVIPTGVTVTSRAPAPIGGSTMVKSGGGDWKIPLGVGASTFRLDISEGTADLIAVDTFGNHTQSNLTLRVGPGALVTNGAAAPAFEGFNSMASLELDGGELRATNGISVLTPFQGSGLFEAYGIRNSILATGTSPSLISDVGQDEGAINIGGNSDVGGGYNFPVTIEVEDVTSSLASDLIISAKLQDNALPAYGRLRSGIIKLGLGTLELSGANLFTGDVEIVDGSVLLAETGRMMFVLGDVSGASNRLFGIGGLDVQGDFAIETAAASGLSSGSWVLEDVASMTGPYGAGFEVTDPDGTPWEDAGGDQWTKDGGDGKTWVFDETTGTLELTSADADFASWALDNGVNGGANGDSDGDGIVNLVEYAIELDPSASDGTVGSWNGSLLSFTKRDVAVANGDVSYAIEESDDLGVTDAWEVVTPTTDDSTTISYELPVGAPAKFARLIVTLNP